MKHDRATRKQARALFAQGWNLSAIAAETGVDRKTLRQWRDTEGWALELTPEQALDARLAWLIAREEKSQRDWQEIKRLNELRNTMRRRAERAEKEERQEKARSGVAAQRRRGHRPRGRIVEAHEVGGVDLDAVRGPDLFAYQLDFLADPARVRWVVKSRQIGFTFVASWEALTDAIDTGRNQIFLSASKAQAGVFRDYVRALAARYLDLDLQGNKDRIQLYKEGQAWATLYFLSTNTATAQSYHGNLYVDEACWIPRFEVITKVAGGMAAQKQYRRTYISTPSTVVHPAWQEFKRLEHERAKGGARHVSLRTITILDAVAQGCDLFDLEDLRAEWDEADFAQLFLCEPLDDELSIFKLDQLERLQSDPASWQVPEGAPVWLGYDPSRYRDSASVVLVIKLPPTKRQPLGRFRVWKRESWRGKSYRWQAARIREYCERHNVQGVAIDTSGMGDAVYELVREFFPRAKAITYTLEAKVELVQNVKRLVDDGLLELPAGDTFLLHAFLAIKQTTTQGGRITYKAGRTADTGHADAFFAAAHALSFEPLRPKRRRMIIS